MPDALTTTPRLGETTGAQHPRAAAGASGPFSSVLGAASLMAGPTLSAFGSPYLSAGGNPANPCGFPGWGDAYAGTYATYRWMLQHPTIRLAREIVTAPLKASTWTYELAKGDPALDEQPAGLAPLPTASATGDGVNPGEVDPATGAPLDPPTPEAIAGLLPPEAGGDPAAPVLRAVEEEAKELVERVLDRLRPAFILDVVRGLDYGWAPFEPIWKLNNGYYEIDRLKPLLVDHTWAVTDGHGNVTALRCGRTFAEASTDKGEKDLPVRRHKAFWWTYDGEAGNPYGRSRLENIRETAWKEWLNCGQQSQALGNKLAGRQAYAMAPAGGYDVVVNGTATRRTHAQDAADALTAFAQGKSPVLTNIALNADDPEVQAKLAGVALVQFQTIDFGSEAPAIDGLLARQRHAEELMFQGFLRPSRVGLEGQHGNNAETLTLTDTGTMESQGLGDDIAGAVQRLADALCFVNFGLPPGTVLVKQSPLVDHKRNTAKQVLMSLLFNPQGQAEAFHTLDMDGLIDTLGLPRRANFNEAMFAADQQRKQAAAQFAAQQPPPPAPPGQPPAEQPGPSTGERSPAPMPEAA